MRVTFSVGWGRPNALEENCAMDQRLRFVGLDLAGELSMTGCGELLVDHRRRANKLRER